MSDDAENVQMVPKHTMADDIETIIFDCLCDPPDKGGATKMATIIRDALRDGGYGIVPFEPTQSMMQSGQRAQCDTPYGMRATYAAARDVYRAMMLNALLPSAIARTAATEEADTPTGATP